ncbi:hypothetical protein MCGE09_00033 [Thaumarchaeota archaeon SCGC AB-539-E09]|nr:hypothetical protein MCGE09_00033 [Thaumarchaeota archaeon SCGC AB-539-E09]
MSLRDRSFRNLAEFWRDELEKLTRGADPRELFTNSARKTLSKYEILLPRRGRGLHLEVNPEALKILRKRRT